MILRLLGFECIALFEFLLFFTEGFVNCLRVCNERFVPVRSNLRLKRFSALSMFFLLYWYY